MALKPKVAFFDFAGCEGCQLAALDLTPEQLLDLLALVDIVEFREVMSERADSYDIALVEGAITRDSDLPRLYRIRATARVVIALGACAAIAGINALKNLQTQAHYQLAVYPEAPTRYETTTARAIAEFITVDGWVPGCPIDTAEFIRVLKNLVLGKKIELPTYPVCVECKLKENRCVYEKGIYCLGPVIRAGCGARCPSMGGYCFGCRGIVPEPNIESLQNIMQQYNLSQAEVEHKFKLFLERAKEVWACGQ